VIARFYFVLNKMSRQKINKKKYELENKKKWTVVNNKIYHKRNVFRLAVVAGSVDFSIGRKWQHETLGRQKNDRKDPTWSCSLLPTVSLTPLLLECIYFPRLLAPNGSRVTKRVEFKRWTEISRC
jgi:hypothetical protein